MRHPKCHATDARLDKRFHHAGHTRNVLARSMQIAGLFEVLFGIQISDREREQLAIAAAFHDIVHVEPFETTPLPPPPTHPRRSSRASKKRTPISKMLEFTRRSTSKRWPLRFAQRFRASGWRWTRE